MLALLAFLVGAAFAQDPGAVQTLLYDLRIDERFVGTRTVTLRYLQTDEGEVRVIESYTELETQVAGSSYRYVNRASARMLSRGASFTSSVSENGKVREVQARRRSDGQWKITVLEQGEIKQTTLPASSVQLSSLELVDPVRHRELTGRARAEVLAAETGTLLVGLVADLGEGTVEVGGQALPVHRWQWSPAAGQVELAWTPEGILVAYETDWMGMELSARLRAAPEARSFGEIGTIPDVVDEVGESEL